MNKFRIFLLLILLSFSQVNGGTMKVILRLNKAAQHDSLGYNILSELPAAVYQEILDGKVKLWDSPEKKIQLQPTTLKDIEKASGVKFSEVDNIFIYEYWDVQKKLVKPSIVGILFATKNHKDDDVSFGFVEYGEIESLLKGKTLGVNANGFINISCLQVLQLKRYDYILMQYGKKIAANVTLSESIKSDVFRKRRLNVSAEPIVREKLVYYKIEKDTFSLSEKMIFSKVDEFFALNVEEFFNIGGDKIESYINYKNITIDKMEVKEVWSKTDNIHYKPLEVIFYANGVPLNPINAEELYNLKIMINDQNLLEFLKTKLFKFNITQINNEKIEDSLTELYRNALETVAWSQLNYFVKETGRN